MGDIMHIDENDHVFEPQFLHLISNNRDMKIEVGKDLLNDKKDCTDIQGKVLTE
jgi:hypothetical protein